MRYGCERVRAGVCMNVFDWLGMTGCMRLGMIVYCYVLLIRCSVLFINVLNLVLVLC